MPDTDINLKTDVALIKKDLKQIERFFTRFDAALDAMADVSQKVAVQSEMIKNTTAKLESIEERMNEHKQEDVTRSNLISDRLEEYRKSSRSDHEKLAAASQQNREERNAEIMVQLSKMNGSLEKRLTQLDDRIKMLEQWKWYIMGLGGVLIFILANVPWSSFFG